MRPSSYPDQLCCIPTSHPFQNISTFTRNWCVEALTRTLPLQRSSLSVQALRPYVSKVFFFATHTLLCAQCRVCRYEIWPICVSLSGFLGLYQLSYFLRTIHCRGSGKFRPIRTALGHQTREKLCPGCVENKLQKLPKEGEHWNTPISWFHIVLILL